MNIKKYIAVSIISLTVSGALLAGCVPGTTKLDPTEVVSVIRTAAAATIVASIPTATGTDRPTITPEPSDTPFPTLTAAGVLLGTQAVSGISEVPCQSAVLVAQIQPSTGQEVRYGKQFNAKWRIRNDGSCPWEPGFKLMHVLGEKFGGGNASVPSMVMPGDTYEFIIHLVAPDVPGLYTGYWRMYNLTGQSFGQSVSVSIVVPKPTPTSTITPSPTKTKIPTAGPSPTPSNTPTPTKTPKGTPATPTNTPKPTKTPQPTSTFTPIPTHFPTRLPKPRYTPTRTPIPPTETPSP